MKKTILIFGSLLIFSITMSSCKESSHKKANESLKGDSIAIVKTKDTIKIAEPLLSIVVPTVKIGKQEWMTEDISAIIYNNGDQIPEAKTVKQWENYGNKKEGCYRKLNNGTIVYNGFVINDKRGILPDGFQIPTFEQFDQMIKFLGAGDSQSGKATKSMASYSIFIEDWLSDEGLEEVEIKSNGSSGFKAKKGGFVYDDGSLGNEGNCSYWWTSSTEGKNNTVVDIGYCSQDLGGGKGSYPLIFGFALRAIKK